MFVKKPGNVNKLLVFFSFILLLIVLIAISVYYYYLYNLTDSGDFDGKLPEIVLVPGEEHLYEVQEKESDIDTLNYEDGSNVNLGISTSLMDESLRGIEAYGIVDEIINNDPGIYVVLNIPIGEEWTKISFYLGEDYQSELMVAYLEDGIVNTKKYNQKRIADFFDLMDPGDVVFIKSLVWFDITNCTLEESICDMLAKPCIQHADNNKILDDIVFFKADPEIFLPKFGKDFKVGPVINIALEV